MRAPQVTPKGPSATAGDIRRAGMPARMLRRLPFDRVNLPTSSCPIGTFFMSLAMVPADIWGFTVRAVHPVRRDGVSRSLFLKRRTRRWRESIFEYDEFKN